MDEKEIISVLEKTGPRTGAELIEETGMEAFQLWRICRSSPGIRSVTIGRRFLRLDRTIDGFARLSPSIRREFQTYTLLGLEKQSSETAERSLELKNNIKEISRAKFNLAKENIDSVVSALQDRDLILEKVCFIIAGDITYQMAHCVPRPEISTGKMVRGSDLDIVIVADDSLPEKSVKELDMAVYRKKHFLIVHPRYREEIDYLIKYVSRVKEQIRFDTFEKMVACKILDEGQYLYGNRDIHRILKDILDDNDIPEKLAVMERLAGANRENAEKCLLEQKDGALGGEYYNLFYTSEEKEEIY